MPSVMCSGVGSTLIRFPRTGVPSQSTTAAANGTGMPGRGEGDDRERAHRAFRGDHRLLEVGTEARGAGVAPVEVTGSTLCALVGHEVGLTLAQHEVVNEGDLLGHSFLHVQN